MSKLKKDLHIGKSLEDLGKHYLIRDLKNEKINLLCGTSHKLYTEAEKYLIEGDEESSFIFYMKYLNVINMISKNATYKKDKQYYNKLLGTQIKQNKALDNAELLSNSLKERYEKLKEQNLNEELEKQNKYREKINADIERMTAPPKTFMNCSELYDLMNDNSKGLLIMDCRPKNDFIDSQIRYKFCLNVPEEIILPGISGGRIKMQLNTQEENLWTYRSIKDFVLLIDWKSGKELIRETPIWLLKETLLNWDPDAKYKSLIHLEGGYENFIVFYPTLCTNPNVKIPETTNVFMDNLEDIEYPFLSDIKMKDETFNDTSFTYQDEKPIINRTTKIAAIQKYDDLIKDTKNITEILSEKEKLADKTLIIDKECLEAENDWKQVESQAEQATDDEKKKLMQRQQELLYNILQLDNKKRDYEAEHNVLLEKIEVFSQLEKEKEIEENGIIISIKAANELEEEAKKRELIKIKEDEIRRIDEERKKLAIEREIKLEYAREQKRHINNTIEDEGLTKIPKIPQFDRNAKPTTTNKRIEQFDRIQRDFSPIPGKTIRGLTGLKNLGNTCYMNSIIQCLSNTTCLVEYFLDGSYKRNINESSRTQGRIVEEVVAVIKALWNGQYKMIASKDLRYYIGQYQEIFRGTEQQDSHEFLTILMDWLHLDLQTLIIKQSIDNTLTSSEKAWINFTKSKESYMLRFFYGQIKSTVKCVHCSKESATYESFSNLSLELPQNSSRCDIQNCLGMYFHGERISGWNCPTCKQKRDAVKKLDISRLPPILVIHFKRFYADPDSMTNKYRKKQTYIQFPLNDLDISSYIARSEIRNMSHSKRLYNLYGISNHYGTMESGHYTAFCKNSSCGKWFKFDDSIVTQLDTADVKSSAAYILFYTSIPDT